MPDLPFLGLGVHVLIAIGFAIHALRSGRNMAWLFILFAFPLLGSIVYFVVELLPGMRGSRAVNTTGRTMRKLVDPGRELREAQRAVALSASADNRIRLAAALMNAGRLDEAVLAYQEAATGLHEFDPALNLGLARTLLAQGRGVEARAVVERYLRQERNRPPAEMPLLYARALGMSGDQNAALAQFERVLADDPNPEVRATFGAYLSSIGQHVRSREILQAFMDDVKHWPAHVRTLNRDWIDLAQTTLRGR